MNITFTRLSLPTPQIAAAFNKWENDPFLIPFLRPNPTRAALQKRDTVTPEALERRLQHGEIYLIYNGDELIGEINYQADPKHLYKKEPGTAWIGIAIGEESARGQGVGRLALTYLEGQIVAQGFQRIELGVFEFNTNAIKLYQRMGYKEIGRIQDYTYWQDRLWQDIRMEKYLK